MAFDNLDAQDKAICEALAGGKSDEEVMQEFGVDLDKIEQLRSVVGGEADEAPAGEATDEATAPAGATQTDATPADEAAPTEGESTPAGEATEGAEPVGEDTQG